MPATTSGTSATIARSASSAILVRKVTSITGNPPATSARASGTASSRRSMVSTGMTGVVNSGVGSAGDIVSIWVRRLRSQALLQVRCRTSARPANSPAIDSATDPIT